MEARSIIYFIVFFIVIKGIVCSNTPPTLSSDKKWQAYETDDVGTPITTLRAQDSEKDTVSFSLESTPGGGDIHTYFLIDDKNRVKVAKNLTGKANQYIVRVRMNDGFDSLVAEVLLVVSKPGEEPERHGFFGGGGGPFGNGPPSPFVNGALPFPGGAIPSNINGQVPINGNGQFPHINGNGQFPHINGNGQFPPINGNGQFPPINGNGQFPWSPTVPSRPTETSDIKVYLDNQEWVVNADDPVETFVGLVKVTTVQGTPYNISLLGSKDLLKIDDSGVVKVAATLNNQVGDHTIIINARTQDTNTSETVVLRVLQPKTPPPSVPLSNLPTFTSSPTAPSSTSSLSPTTHHVFPNSNGKNSQDLLVIGGPSGAGSGNQLGDTDLTTDAPQEAPGSNVSLTVVPIVLVAGITPLGLVLYCYWRRIQRRKARAEAKESAVVYTEKGEEAVATQVPPRRKSSQFSNFAAVFHKRAQSNKYEEDIGNGEGNIKRRLSEISAPITDTWEFPRHHLKFMGILGEGCFGQVWKCEAKGINNKPLQIVAVKTLKESAGERERRDLVQELKVLKHIGKHVNVVSLLGCCTEKDPIFIILEYLVGGKLQSYLRASRADTSYNNLHGQSSSLTPRDLTHFTYQISRGMEFLARNGIIHRDLAARNVLVGEDKIVKVADFGFARDVANNSIYERKSDGRLPIRWMAPESLFDNIFTTKSDVWSFGVLLWEIVTLGSTPYPGLGAAEVMKKIKEGYRLEKPNHCRREIYNIMYYCWDKNPAERPSFTELVHTLDRLVLTEVDYIELDRFPDHMYYNVITEKSDELL